MIHFGKILIEGFCSIGSFEYQLGNTGITVVRGATGEGKTSILSALVWCIYGKNIKGKPDVNTWKKYQTKEYLGTKVELYFNTPTGVHKIIRCQKYKGDVNGAKGKDRLIYEIDASEVTAKSKNDIQSLIVANIGMSYNLFMNSVLFGQGMKRLIQESGADKKNLFEEIFELDYLSKARDIAKEELSNSQQYLSALTHQRDVFKSKLDSAVDTIEHLKQQVRDNSKDTSKAIAELTKVIKALAKAKSGINHKAIIESEIKVKDKLKSVADKISDVKDKINDARDKSKISLEDFIDKLVKLLRGGDLKSSLKMVMGIKDAFITIDKAQDELSNLNHKSQKLRSKLQDISKELGKLRDIESKLKLYDTKVANLKEDSVKKVNKTSIKKYKDIKEEYLKKCTDINIKINNQKSRVDDYKWVYEDALGNKGIKAFLFESSLDYLNEVLDSYRDTLGFSILFYVDLASNKKDFATQIIMDGIEVSYEELSGGQKQLCNLAMAFAMNEVMSKSKGINIAFLDEVFENLSSEYIELVISLIRTVYRDKTLFLISHQDSLPIPNSKVLNVTRARGISQYH